MNDTLDEGMIPGKPARKAKKATVQLGLSFLCYVLVTFGSSLIQIGYSESRLLIGGIMILGILALFFSLSGLILSVKAFLKPKEEGWLKYLALMGNGVLSLPFCWVILANALDLYRAFFT